MNINIERNNVKNITVSYETIIEPKTAYISVTEWKNGEGYDVEINEPNLQYLFQLTYESWKALKKAMREIDKTT